MMNGIIVVPLYARQAPAELAAMIRDCEPRLLCCGDNALRDAMRTAFMAAAVATRVPLVYFAMYPPCCLTMLSCLARRRGLPSAPHRRLCDAADPITIIYTSGTSGEAKGVVLTVGNVTHMLGCTSERLDQLMVHRFEF